MRLVFIMTVYKLTLLHVAVYQYFSLNCLLSLYWVRSLSTPVTFCPVIYLNFQITAATVDTLYIIPSLSTDYCHLRAISECRSQYRQT